MGATVNVGVAGDNSDDRGVCCLMTGTIKIILKHKLQYWTREVIKS